MDFSLKEEHQLLAETARRVGERFGLDYWYERDRRKEFAEAFWQAVCDAGLCGAALAEEYGGSGLGMQEMNVEHGGGLPPGYRGSIWSSTPWPGAA